MAKFITIYKDITLLELAPFDGFTCWEYIFTIMFVIIALT